MIISWMDWQFPSWDSLFQWSISLCERTIFSINIFVKSTVIDFQTIWSGGAGIYDEKMIQFF